MKKIAILGYSGSGKSTLARYIAEKKNIPVLHLDSIYFTANWQERNTSEVIETVKKYMMKEQWIIEGNYSRFLQKERCEQADLIIFMLFPRRVCLPRLIQRYQQYKNKTRPDMAEGCEEKIDWPFIKWVMIDSRKRIRKKKNKKLIKMYSEKVIVLRNPMEVASFCEYLEKVSS